MAARVPRCWNDRKVIVHYYRLVSANKPFSIRDCRHFSLMNYALAAKMASIFVSIGYIVSMRQEDISDSAQTLELGKQVCGVARRINKPVALPV